MVGVKQQAKNRMRAVNARGYYIGEDHPRAVLSNHEVDLVLQLLAEGLSQACIAAKMEISRRSVRDMASGRRRAQLPDRYIKR
jgi:DNA-binding NarL/FixJ family response regulator